MKKILLAGLFTAITFYYAPAQLTNSNKPGVSYSFNQLRSASLNFEDDTTVTPKDYNYYIHKSRNQRITGLSLLGGGLLIGGAALLVAEAQSNNFNDDNDGLIGAMFIISATAGLTSIPYMIMAHANHSKAKAALKSQKTGFGIPSGNKAITGITISLPIGK